jgi:hypothetical protein
MGDVIVYVLVEDRNHILQIAECLQATAFPIWSYHILGGLASYISG